MDDPTTPTAPASPYLQPSTNITAMVLDEEEEKTVKEAGYGETENQNQLRFAIKQEPIVHIMNQSNPSPLLPSFSFPPLSSPSSPSLAPHPPLSSLAPSLFPPTSTTSSSSSTTTLPSLPPSPATSSPPQLHPRTAAPSPLATSPSGWEQQTLARLNSLTQMTSQIASIALEKSAVKSETAVQEADKSDSVVEWVTSISRSLQTELQSVYLTLHGGADQSPLPVSPILPATAPLAAAAPVPSLLSPSLSSLSPLSLSPSLPSFLPPSLHPPVQSEKVATLVLAAPPRSATLPNMEDSTGENKKGRRRRKTKTKDSFNHMQRKCASCQRTETTKWRHGPLGSNTLCNTCGLAYSRKKKREAEQAAKASAASPPPS